MISRIGNQLFGVGRHLERAEQVASYTKIQYLTSMDAPFPEYKTTIWAYLLSCTGSDKAFFDIHTQATEEKVFHFLAIDEANPSSIRANVAKAREMARGARNSISAELWEHINCFYHAMNAFSREKLHQKGFHGFAQKVEKFSYTIKGYIDSVMLRNEEWKMLLLGYHLERALQANHLLLTNLQEIRNTSSGNKSRFEYYQVRSMLESLGAYEMYKQYYKTHVNRQDFLHFMIFNTAFPKSIIFNLNCIQGLDMPDGALAETGENGFMQQAARLQAELLQQQAEIMQHDEIPFLEQNLQRLQGLAEIMEQEQMTY